MSVVVTTPQAGKDVGQLHDQLLRAGLVPERVHSDGTDIVLTFPDGTVEAEVDAVVAAHVPMVRYDPATRLREVAALRRSGSRAALRARAAAAATVDDLKAVLLAHLKAEEEDAG